MVVQAAVTLPQGARPGAVKILANLSPAALLRHFRTFRPSEESGIPGLYASGWFGLFGPKGPAERGWWPG